MARHCHRQSPLKITTISQDFVDLVGNPKHPMPSFAALLILLISLWLCSVIDGLPHLLPGLSLTPLWIWLGLGAVLLSWVIKDN